MFVVTASPIIPGVAHINWTPRVALLRKGETIAATTERTRPRLYNSTQFLIQQDWKVFRKKYARWRLAFAWKGLLITSWSVVLRTTFSARLASLAAKRSLRSLIRLQKLLPPWPYPPLATNLDPSHHQSSLRSQPNVRYAHSSVRQNCSHPGPTHL